MQSVWTISLSLFPTATSIDPSDKIMLWRGGLPYTTDITNVGFLPGTTTWFYSNSAPVGWQIVDTAGDSILGVVSDDGQFTVGGTQLYNSGAQFSGTGSWKMAADQLTPHSHTITSVFAGESGTTIGNAVPYLTNFKKSTTSTATYSAPQWGSWRPVTSIGIIAIKL
jgi:hypothetical protein